jgi:hypothetical protein
MKNQQTHKAGAAIQQGNARAGIEQRNSLDESGP